MTQIQTTFFFFRSSVCYIFKLCIFLNLAIMKMWSSFEYSKECNDKVPAPGTAMSEHWLIQSLLKSPLAKGLMTFSCYFYSL